MSTPKTSESHPLRIDNLAIRGLRGVIGLTFCPGKKQQGAVSGDWDRDLSIDLEAIKLSGAKALVTLMETHELAKFQVPVSELRDKTAAVAIEWHHLPIRDVDVPDEKFERLWTMSGPRLRSLLLQGEKDRYPLPRRTGPNWHNRRTTPRRVRRNPNGSNRSRARSSIRFYRNYRAGTVCEEMRSLPRLNSKQLSLRSGSV